MLDFAVACSHRW